MDSTEFNIFYRPNEPICKLPFWVRSVGSRREQAGFIWEKPQRYFLEFHWCMQGEALVTQKKENDNEQSTTWSNEQCFIIPPHTDCNITILSDNWESRWFTLTGPEIAFIIQHYQLQPEIKQVGICPIHHFLELEQHVLGIGDTWDRKSCALAFELFMQISAPAPYNTPNTIIEKVTLFIEQRIGDADLSVNTIAQHFSLHRVSLSRLFKQHLQQSPITYINNKRMERAKHYLRDTPKSIEQIAYNCGFSDYNYFFRCFKKHTKTTPTEYRRALS